jgi:hypothetical protein
MTLTTECLVDRLTECLFSIHSMVHSPTNRANTESELMAPARQSTSLAVEIYHSACARVIRLLNARGPFAVARLVSLGIVDSFKRMTCRRFWSHIFNKVSTFVPPFAYLDAPSAVGFEVFMIRLVASCEHVLPARIKRMVRLPVFHHPSCCCLRPVASTGLRLSSSQATSVNEFF